MASPPSTSSSSFTRPILTTNKTHEQREEEQRAYKQYDHVAATLPSRKGVGITPYRKYHNFWYPEHLLLTTMAIRDTFQAHPSDLLLATQPKSGTTWLKAIIFSIVNRSRHALDRHHPLLTSSPHDCFPFLHTFYDNQSLPVHLDSLPSPRLLATHIPYSALPASVPDSGCRIVYLCRDPKDTLVSLWHYLKQLLGVVVPFDEAFEMVYEGNSPFGPIWNHVLEYWRESLRRPDKVLFLKYEELVADPAGRVKRLAEFAGCPLSEEEEEKGVVEGIIRMCSFEKLSKVEANKTGEHGLAKPFKNAAFFRKGKVGDWREYLSPEMAQKMDDLVAEKFHAEGLIF